MAVGGPTSISMARPSPSLPVASSERRHDDVAGEQDRVVEYKGIERNLCVKELTGKSMFISPPV
jgi:hypothetical protein